MKSTTFGPVAENLISFGDKQTPIKLWHDVEPNSYSARGSKYATNKMESLLFNKFYAMQILQIIPPNTYYLTHDLKLNNCKSEYP